MKIIFKWYNKKINNNNIPLAENFQFSHKTNSTIPSDPIIQTKKQQLVENLILNPVCVEACVEFEPWLAPTQIPEIAFVLIGKPLLVVTKPYLAQIHSSGNTTTKDWNRFSLWNTIPVMDIEDWLICI